MTETRRTRLRRSLIHQVPLLIWLIVLWMLLWGSFSWLNLVTGALIALLVTRVFYLPPIELTGRFHPWWFLVLAVTFVYDLARASVQVAWLAVDPRSVPHSSVIAVQLHTRSDLIMTLVSIGLSLVPGSLVVEADRLRSVLYVHALNTATAAEVERARQSVLTMERRVVRALGPADDLRRIIEGRELT